MTRGVLTGLLGIARSQTPVIRLMRRAATAVLRRTEIVATARLLSGDVLYVDMANAVGRTIWLRGDYAAEEPITRLITSNLRTGDVFFDVGANVGFFSLTASRIVGPTGHVYAFEPLPKLASLLRRTVSVNGLENVTVAEAAVGRTTGVASIASMPDSAYSHIIDGARRVDTTHGGWKPIRVASLSLDDYVANVVHRLPTLIKMDIEGSEIEAIAGAHSILSDPKGPDVICEVGETHLARFNHTADELFERFIAFGYRPLNPDTGAGMRVGDLSQHEYNVFFSKTRV